MTITDQQEHKLANGQTISIQLDASANKWEVACWNADETAHWYKEFDNAVAAKAEYDRWAK